MGGRTLLVVIKKYEYWLAYSDDGGKPVYFCDGGMKADSPTASNNAAEITRTIAASVVKQFVVTECPNEIVIGGPDELKDELSYHEFLRDIQTPITDIRHIESMGMSGIAALLATQRED